MKKQQFEMAIEQELSIEKETAEESRLDEKKKKKKRKQRSLINLVSFALYLLTFIFYQIRTNSIFGIW